MNWNKGVRPNIRTSLSRRAALDGWLEDSPDHEAGTASTTATSSGSESGELTTNIAHPEEDLNHAPSAPEISMPDATPVAQGNSIIEPSTAQSLTQPHVQDGSLDQDTRSIDNKPPDQRDMVESLPQDAQRSDRSDVESGELTDDAETSHAPNDARVVHTGIHKPARDPASEDEQDDMMRYADSTQPHAAPSSSVMAPVGGRPTVSGMLQSVDGAADSAVQTPSEGSLTLSDLTPSEIRLQLRYFYIGVEPTSIPLAAPVYCLVCGTAGHRSASCRSLTCPECGAFNAHPQTLCPKLHRCSRCQQQGHLEVSCTSKLKAAAGEEVPNENSPCTLCGRPGHAEMLCEAVWRSSGRPWERDLVPGQARLFCFECGGSGHLGNDCVPRNPGKEPGSSSWSLRPATQPARAPIRQGQARKGLPPRPPAPQQLRAGQQRPPPPMPSLQQVNYMYEANTIDRGQGVVARRSGPASAAASHDESSGEEFFRDRPNPRGRGGISIRGVASSRGSSQAGTSRGGGGRGSRGGGRKRGRGARGDGRGGGRGRGDGGGEAYRPMPSAASKAWSKGKT